MGKFLSGNAKCDKILKGVKVALKHFVFDFEDPVKDKEPEFQSSS